MSVSKKAKKRLKALASGIFACALAFGITGCATQQQSEPEPEPELEEAYRIFGVEDEDALNMAFNNETGKDIVSLAAKQSGTDDTAYGKDLIAGDEPWAEGETITLFCDTYEVIEQPIEEGSPISDVELLPTYDLQMTFADGTAVVLHDVTFQEAEEVQVHMDGASGLAYMTFLELDGSETSTLQAEIAVQTAAEAEAAAALQARQEAEAAAAAAAAAAQQQQSNAANSSRSYTYNSGNGGGSGSGAGQSQDSCISPDDLVLNE